MKKYPIYLTMQQVKVLKEIFEDEVMKHYQVDTFNEPIELSCLNARTRNVIRNEPIETYFELSQFEKKELLRMPNFGKNSLKLLKNHIKQKFPYDWRSFKFMREEAFDEDLNRQYERINYKGVRWL